MATTHNIGQVAGLHIGTTAPTNTVLIWYDSTPSIMAHKVWNEATGDWTLLKADLVSSITYSELQTLAKGEGLTVGSWYRISDVGDILALAITATKVQYVDVSGNFVVDDLASVKIYTVTSNNLTIDDITGVWNEDTGLLEFAFDETGVADAADTDTLLGSGTRDGGLTIQGLKFRLKQLVSSLASNALTWNGGVYFDFSTALASVQDKTGGVVSKTQYDKDMSTLSRQVQTAASTVQQTLDSAKTYTDSQVTATQIYNKALPTAPSTGTPTDIIQGNTLYQIVSKIQGWINTFKTAVGISIGDGYVASTSKEDKVATGDTLQTAVSKVEGGLARWCPSDIITVDVGGVLSGGTFTGVGLCMRVGDTPLFGSSSTLYNISNTDNPNRPEILAYSPLGSAEVIAVPVVHYTGESACVLQIFAATGATATVARVLTATGTIWGRTVTLTATVNGEVGQFFVFNFNLDSSLFTGGTSQAQHIVLTVQ